MPPTDPEDEFTESDEHEDDLESGRKEEDLMEDDLPPDDYRIHLLERQTHYLETVLAITISALIILSLGVNWYLFKQTRLTRGQVHQQRAYVNKVQNEFDKRSTNIREFISSLEAYSKTDPEFQRILTKHRKGLGKYYTTRPANGDEPAPTPDE